MNQEISKTYLGIDWGEKRIGLALADGETMIAMPFKTVENIQELLEIIKAEEISCLVIGSPLTMRDAKLGNTTYASFLAKLKAQTVVPVIAIDERLSSKAADVLGFGQKDRASRDEGAATLILQNYLDSIS